MHLDCSIPAHEPKSFSPKGWKLSLHSEPKLHNVSHCSRFLMRNRDFENKIISKVVLLKILKFPIVSRITQIFVVSQVGSIASLCMSGRQS